MKAAAETFRPNKKFDAAEAIIELGVGEALVSFLDAKGVPTPVERCFVAPPQRPHRPGHRRRARGGHRGEPARRQVRPGGRSRVGLRGADGPRHRRPGASRRTATPPAPRAAAASTMRRRRAKRDRAEWSVGQGAVSAPADERRSPSPSRACARRSRSQSVLAGAEDAGGRSDTITTTIIKSAARTATNIAVREASKAIFGSGRNSRHPRQPGARRAGGIAEVVSSCRPERSRGDLVSEAARSRQSHGPSRRLR